MIDTLVDAMRELACAMREHAAELRKAREHKHRARRVKAVRLGAAAQDVPVSETGAAAARRALAKVRR